jgi:diamine N-acetyltransferase
MKEIKIAKIIKTDLPVLLPFAKQTFHDAFFNQNTLENYNGYVNTAFTIEKFSDELDNLTSHFYWIIDKNESPLAWLKLNEEPTFTEHVEGNGIEVQRIYVDSNSHGKGFGKLLLEFSENFAKQKNKSFIWLGVWEKNLNAIAFYEKCGYRKFDQHDFVFGDEVQTDYLMRKDFFTTNQP